MDAETLPLDYERLKSIDETSKYLVFGWISEAQHLLPQNNTYYNIPCGVSIICLLYYSPPFTCGTYDVEGTDEAKSGRSFNAKYCIEFLGDGTIFGTRNKQLICGSWNKENCAINFVLTWHGNCYQYHGFYDTVIKQINGSWMIRDEKKKNNSGQNGTFKYSFKYKSAVSTVQHDPNNINDNKLQHEYQVLLQKYEKMRKQASEAINIQNAENLSLKLLLLSQAEQIDDYKQEINDLMKERDEYKQQLNVNVDADNNDNDDGDDKDEYNNWDWNDILKWIMDIDDNKYGKYADVLKEKLCQENVCGNQLGYADKNDLHRFGITEFGDKIEIMKHIQLLIDKKHIN